MEWIVGIYLAIGVLKALGAWANPNPAKKPIWMSAERNPLIWVLNFAMYVVGWPLAKR